MGPWELSLVIHSSEFDLIKDGLFSLLSVRQSKLIKIKFT